MAPTFWGRCPTGLIKRTLTGLGSNSLCCAVACTDFPILRVNFGSVTPVTTLAALIYDAWAVNVVFNMGLPATTDNRTFPLFWDPIKSKLTARDPGDLSSQATFEAEFIGITGSSFDFRITQVGHALVAGGAISTYSYPAAAPSVCGVLTSGPAREWTNVAGPFVFQGEAWTVYMPAAKRIGSFFTLSGLNPALPAGIATLNFQTSTVRDGWSLGGTWASPILAGPGGDHIYEIFVPFLGGFRGMTVRRRLIIGGVQSSAVITEAQQASSTDFTRRVWGPVIATPPVTGSANLFDATPEFTNATLTEGP